MPDFSLPQPAVEPLPLRTSMMVNIPMPVYLPMVL